MGELRDLPNIGKVLEGNLKGIGVVSKRQLAQLGSKEAFARIKSAVDPGACLHMLYGLQGAIEGIKDVYLCEGTKQDLKRFYKSL